MLSLYIDIYRQIDIDVCVYIHSRKGVLFLKFDFYYFMHICFCMPRVCRRLWSPENGAGSPVAGVYRQL